MNGHLKCLRKRNVQKAVCALILICNGFPMIIREVFGYFVIPKFLVIPVGNISLPVIAITCIAPQETRNTCFPMSCSTILGWKQIKKPKQFFSLQNYASSRSALFQKFTAHQISFCKIIVGIPKRFSRVSHTGFELSPKSPFARPDCRILNQWHLPNVD